MRKMCFYAGRAGLLCLAAMAWMPQAAAQAKAEGGNGTDASSAASAASAGKPAAPSGACIETEVNGYRALSYDCLNQKMAPTTAPKPPAVLGSEAITQGPPNQMGLSTPATIGNRMGNTFGTSAYPQRPAP
ncbi:hypothetical protein [Achromobacter sp.]|uniref:hypothetical protein n=1 Tax=Achromobacter sp. TaxID=134375 RepID=UPI0028B0636B|nr:hypothetical protein [Achromobacter sp.]